MCEFLTNFPHSNRTLIFLFLACSKKPYHDLFFKTSHFWTMFMVMFQLMRMSSLMLRTNYRTDKKCVQFDQTSNVWVYSRGNFHKFTQSLFLHLECSGTPDYLKDRLFVTKNELFQSPNISWLNNLFMTCNVSTHKDVSYDMNKLSICVQSTNITLDLTKCGGNFHKFTQFTPFLSVTKKDLSWMNNLFMVIFQLIRMSSYAKNKLQLCSVTQHQCRRRQMSAKFSLIL